MFFINKLGVKDNPSLDPATRLQYVKASIECLYNVGSVCNAATCYPVIHKKIVLNNLGSYGNRWETH